MTTNQQPEAVRDALLRTLRIIVAHVREGGFDIESECQEFADVFDQCFRDAIADAYLRAMSEFERRFCLPVGAAN